VALNKKWDKSKYRLIELIPYFSPHCDPSGMPNEPLQRPKQRLANSFPGHQCPFRRPQLFSCRLMREAGAISTQEVVDGEQAARCGEESILA
jgi:hypothetical protein